MLKAGFDVYPSLVDDKGIDAVIGYKGTYFEVQVKSAGSWTGQRGFDFRILQKNTKRIFVVVNHAIDDIRYFTAYDILNEPAWKETITWGSLSQIPLNSSLLDKYDSHTFDGLVKYIENYDASKPT